MSYKQHAWRHLPDGTDPLPLGTPWMAISFLAGSGLASGVSLAAVDLDPAVVTWDTSDSPGTPASSAIFGLAQSGGAGAYLLQFKQDGFYRVSVWLNCSLSGHTPAAGSIAEVELTGSNYSVAGPDIGPWLANVGGAWQVQASRVAFYSLASTPYLSAVNIGQNSGFTTDTAYVVDVLAEQISPTPATNF